MAKPKPLMAKSSGTDHANAAVESALRTLEAEAGGVAALAAALQAALGRALRRRGRPDPQRQGPRDRHRARQVGPYRAQVGGDLCLHRHAGLLRPRRGGEPRRPRHDHADDVILALSWSGEQPEMQNLITYAARFRDPHDRDDGGARNRRWRRPPTLRWTLPKAREACPHNLAPTTSSLMHAALGDALAIALLEGRGFTSVDFSRAASRRQARRDAEIYPRPHALRRRRAAQAARHQNVGRADRDDGQRLWLRRHRRSAAARSPASSPTAICAARCGPT